MIEIINKILAISFSGFWQFCGMAMLLNGLAYFVVNGILQMWSRSLRTMMVLLRGWPPAHLDADGDMPKPFSE